MNVSILKRLEQLEKAVPNDLIIEYQKDSEMVRKTMKEFCNECRESGTVYKFRVVDGNRMDDIDMLIELVDELAKGTL